MWSHWGTPFKLSQNLKRQPNNLGLIALQRSFKALTKCNACPSKWKRPFIFVTCWGKSKSWRPNQKPFNKFWYCIEKESNLLHYTNIYLTNPMAFMPGTEPDGARPLRDRPAETRGAPTDAFCLDIPHGLLNAKVILIISLNNMKNNHRADIWPRVVQARDE